MTDIAFHKQEVVIFEEFVLSGSPRRHERAYFRASQTPPAAGGDAPDARVARRRKRARRHRECGRSEAGGTKKFGGGTFWFFALVTR
jgi:hypothetical protein